MNLKRIALALPALDQEQKKLPNEIRIVPFGRSESEKGPYTLTAEGAQKVLARAQEWGNRHSFDYEHRALYAATSGDGAAPAAGWYDLEIRDDGLWAVNIEWTERAAAYIRAREYRYFSPAFYTDKDGNVTELVNVALTNLPATHDVQPIAASKPHIPSEEKPMKSLLVALSLPETATEGDALSALSKVKEAGNSLLVLTGTSTVSEALGVVGGWKAEAEKVTALSAKVAEYEKAARTAEVEQLIAAGKAEGKIAPAAETFFRDMGTKDPAQLKAFLSVATPVVPTETKREPNKDGATVSLTAEELKVASMLRIDTKALAAKKAELEARGE